jgi:hypothetical protein
VSDFEHTVGVPASPVGQAGTVFGGSVPGPRYLREKQGLAPVAGLDGDCDVCGAVVSWAWLGSTRGTSAAGRGTTVKGAVIASGVGVN